MAGEWKTRRGFARFFKLQASLASFHPRTLALMGVLVVGLQPRIRLVHGGTMDPCHDLFHACRPFHWNIRVHGPPDATIRCVHRGLLSDFSIPSRGCGSPMLKNSDKAAQASQPTAPSLAFPALPACSFSNPSYHETKVSWFRWQALCKLSAVVSWITVSFNLDSSLPVPVPLRLDL